MLTVEFDRIALAPGKKILDAGCGSGRHLCAAYRKPGVIGVGIDRNIDDLNKASMYMRTDDDRQTRAFLLARADVTALPFQNGSFDVVICSEVLEHIPQCRTAIAELLRVLKDGGDLLISVPRFFPERICWLLSRAYHQEAGGHVRIFRKNQLCAMLQEAGAHCRFVRYRHGLHSPYWWLKCLVGHRREDVPLVRAYRRFLEWDIIKHPPLTALLDRLLNPIIGKSIVFYLTKGRS